MAEIRIGGQAARSVTQITQLEYEQRILRWPEKFLTFTAAGHEPHAIQTLAHSSEARYLVLSAGRRGGKTRGAGWEFAYRCNPANRHELEKLGVKLPADPNKELQFLVGVPNRNSYQTAWREFKDALRAQGIPYEEHKGNNTIGIPNLKDTEIRSRIFNRGAMDPDSFRGEGYAGVWLDEPAFIPGPDAWDILSIALSDKLGFAILSTSPGSAEKNWWFYNEFLDQGTKDKPGKGAFPFIETISWVSIENPYFSQDEWENQRLRKHPLVFMREFMARWQKGAGSALKFEWLQHYSKTDPERSPLHRNEHGQVMLSRYRTVIGIDPAISEDPEADFFCAQVLLIDPETGIAYLYDKRHGHYDFPRQIEIIEELTALYNPLVVGIEDVAYQRSLIQQTQWIGKVMNVMPVQARGKKEERLLGLGPVFRAGRVLVDEDDNDFVKEWIEFPNSKHDDRLDAVDIALRVAGTLMPDIALPVMPTTKNKDTHITRAEAIRELVKGRKDKKVPVNEYMGSLW